MSMPYNSMMYLFILNETWKQIRYRLFRYRMTALDLKNM